MSLTSIGIPGSHSAAEPLLGQSYVYLDMSIRQQLAERFSVREILDYWGDLAGTGSDTLALRRVGGFGWGAAFTAMSSETELIVARAITAALQQMSIGRHGIKFQETFTRAILSGDRITLDAIAVSIVDSVEATMRALAATTVGTFTNNAANAAATCDVDDAIALREAFEGTTGFDANMEVISMCHPLQLGHLRASMRSETALKFPERFDADQGLQSNAGFRFEFLNMKWYASGDIATSASTYLGGAYVRGALGWAKSSVSNVGELGGGAPLYIDEIGLLITRGFDGATAQKELVGNLWTGVGQVSTDVLPAYQFKNHT